MSIIYKRKILKKNIFYIGKNNIIYNIKNDIPGERLKYNKKIYYIGNDKTKIVINYKVKQDNKKALIWIPGRNDYFYHYHISEKIRFLDIYSIDLRNCGESIEEGCIPHYCNNLEEYFEELDLLYDDLINKKNYEEIILYGHSTGGLVSILYYEYNKKNKNNKIDKLILNSPFLYLKLDCLSNIILNYIIYYISDYIPSLNLSKLNQINKYTTYVKNIMKIDIKKKSNLEIPVMTDWITSIIYNQYRIQNNKINIEDIPILFISSDRSVNDLNKEIGDSVLDIVKMNEIGKKLSDKNNIIFKKIKNGLHDVLISHGNIDDKKTSLGQAFNILNNFINS
jgi:pimeloyl-ACP methyl ester carboxylesterase